MPYLFVGAGQAGSAIVDDVFGHRRISRLATPLVFNSTIRDLQNLSNVDRSAWFGVSETDGLVRGETDGFESRVTGGFGRDPKDADSVMEERSDEVTREIRTVLQAQDEPFSYVFVFLGLGGGTGCGIAPHLVESIRESTESDVDVIAVGVLPNTTGPVSEGDEQVSAPRQAWNALYGLDRLEDHVEGIVLVDNERLAYQDAAESRFSEYNEYVASAIVDLVSGPVLERIDPSTYDDVDAQVVDMKDIVTTLRLGSDGERTGYATIGRAVTMTRSLAGYLLPFVGKRAVDGVNLLHQSVSKQTLADADPTRAQKALGSVRAPASYVSGDDYRINVSAVDRQLKSFCGEVNYGMTFTERNLASFTTLLTYDRSDLERLDAIEEHAAEHDETPREEVAA
ncbi:Tubulin/FtsZ family, GTPase domain [Halogeometricum rufum]|uniref:Tubulin/FtsZ family, GTPase domain n=1 Tax=Halogeometricum rufum TaxID=553469 RepID=A0A1I6GUC6_9EURY|nr:hypothetical protein [Halogeometricum rufum]SFR45667.1 Tubulin/FtsZ family, GTPase domain [Halogeometricum rufum]